MRNSVIVACVAIGFVLLWQTRILVLLTLLGGLLGLAVKPAVDRLERMRVPRTVWSPLVVLGALAVVLAVLLWSGPTLVTEFNAFRQRVPESIDRLDNYLSQQHGGILDAIIPRDSAGPDALASISDRVRNALSGQTANIQKVIFGAVTSTIEIVAGFGYVVFVTLFIAMDPYVYRRGLLLLVPEASRDRYALLTDKIAATLRKWLATQFIAMIVMGLVTTLALLLLGVKSAIPLGILAGILEFVPNVGPVLSAVPGVLIAFAESPEKALVVAITYWGLQFLENHLLIPYLMQEGLDLPPALTVAWQSLMALVFGLLGLFVAVPMLATAYVSIRFLYVRGDVPPMRDEPAAGHEPPAPVPP